MKDIRLACALVLCVAAGCVGMHTDPAGRPVRDIIEDHAGHRIEYFDQEGNPLPGLPKDRPGSVSIHMQGQDNYSFDENGLVLRHQRSYGADYTNGVWRDVE